MQPTLATYQDDLPQLDDAQLGSYRDALEWWLFDVDTPEGDCLIITLARKNPLCSWTDAALSVEFRNRQRKVTYIEVDLFPFRAFGVEQSADHTLLTLGPNSLSIQKGPANRISAYVLGVKTNGFEADLRFTPWHQGFKPTPDGCYFTHKQRPELKTSVNFAAPRMTVEGDFALHGKKQSLTGIGYHDHPWATDFFFSTFAGWHWGKLYSDEACLLYADVQPSVAYTGDLRFLYHATTGIYEPVIATDYEDYKVDWSQWKREGWLGLLSFPHRTQIEAEHTNCRIYALAAYRHTLINRTIYERSNVDFESGGQRQHCGCWTEYARFPYSLRVILVVVAQLQGRFYHWWNKFLSLFKRPGLTH